jgi:triacylglycerol esterase/lipase EstA (alpha/beta hydrolase family)
MTQRILRRAIATLATAAITSLPAPANATATGVNDYACRSTSQPTPVVVLHGLTANKDEDLNVLQANLAKKGYCTFSLTYGEDAMNPFVGGRAPIEASNTEISAFIADVLGRTHAAQVDIVGHSEGGFMSLYVTKFGNLQGRVRKVVAIAPPTHGTQFVANVAQLRDAVSFGRVFFERMATATTFPAVPELLPGGTAVAALESGPIAQPDVQYTIIQSRQDEMVTPVETAFVREPGVRNVFVQDFCPIDPVGHIWEAYDRSVWMLVYNALDPAANKVPAGLTCSIGLPF